MVIADRLAIYVDSLFESASVQNISIAGIPTILGLFFFAFQLYIDFSAYSQIAIGAARTLGFNLNINFRRPYLSSSFNNFWERWHISLSQWMRDYIFIPLGGSREGKSRTIRNLLIVFAVSGLWHGASWNFVICGVINAVFIILLDPVLSKLKIKGVLSSVIVFSMWTLSLIFFRSGDLTTAMMVIKNLGFSNLDNIFNFGLLKNEMLFSLILIACLMIFEYLEEWIERKEGSLINSLILNRSLLIRWSFYLVLVFSIIFFGVYATNNDNSFIYFQF